MDANMTKSVQVNDSKAQVPGVSESNESGSEEKGSEEKGSEEKGSEENGSGVVESKKQESAKEVIKCIADTANMDEANKQAYNVLMDGTREDFLRHVFTEQGTGRVRSYAEMRMMYG